MIAVVFILVMPSLQWDGLCVEQSRKDLAKEYPVKEQYLPPVLKSFPHTFLVLAFVQACIGTTLCMFPCLLITIIPRFLTAHLWGRLELFLFHKRNIWGLARLSISPGHSQPQGSGARTFSPLHYNCFPWGTALHAIQFSEDNGILSNVLECTR